MATIVTRSGKGSPLTNTEVDANFTNLNNDKLETLPVASNTAHGGIKLNSNNTQLIAVNALSSSAGRTYAVQLNSGNQAVVNVPWVDTNTVGGDADSVDGKAIAVVTALPSSPDANTIYFVTG